MDAKKAIVGDRRVSGPELRTGQATYNLTHLDGGCRGIAGRGCARRDKSTARFAGDGYWDGIAGWVDQRQRTRRKAPAGERVKEGCWLVGCE